MLCFALGCSSSDSKGAVGTTTTTTDGSAGNPHADAGNPHTDAGGPALREPVLPKGPDTCPSFVTDATTSPSGGMVNVLGQDVLTFAGQRRDDVKAPIVFYWHGTGSVAQEAQGFMSTQIAEVQAEGGLFVSFTTTIGTGTTTGNFVWYTGDYDSADLILACALQQLNIDPHQIYAAGCSAGGLQAGTMVSARSSYLAAAMPNSGGGVGSPPFEDPTHIPAIITAHGSEAADFVILHFKDVSIATDQRIANLGGMAVDCDHGGGHCGDTQEIIAAQWQFLKDHPFGITTDPYANGLPSTFPSVCTKFSARDH